MRPMLTLSLLFASAHAHAAGTWVQVCGEYSVDYDDARSAVGDDYWTHNGDKTARGVRMKVTRNSDGAQMYYGYTAYTGVSAGCSPMMILDTSQTYRVRLYSEARVGGNTIVVRNNDTSKQRYYTDVETAWRPTVGVTRHTSDTGIHDAWNIAAAAGYAQARRRGGLSGETYVLYDQECSSGGSCSTSSAIYLSDTGASHKYIIVHEMGHALSRKANGNQGFSFSYDADTEDCHTRETRAHEAASKEYQSAAAIEGFAHFYAAVVFNSDSQSGCGFAYYKTVDWDLDGTLDSADVSCEAAPMAGLTSGDWLGNTCGGTVANRGTEYDWLRFWWDLTTDQDVYFTDCVEIFADANPHTWNATDSGSSSSDPATRLRGSAAVNLLLAQYLAEETVNGVQR